jgi:[acyl-carrier-protein] S-malonyltransferase
MSLCWLCPGQGSQTPDMLARLAADPPLAGALEALRDALAAETLALAEDPARCFENRHAQPLIVLYGCTVASALREAGIAPDIVAGYSVGELTAHSVAGALTPREALKIASARARAMDSAAPPGYGMLAVRGAAVGELVGADEVEVAITNDADHAILAGSEAALHALGESLAARGAHVVPLAVSVPAHSHWLAEAVEPFAQALRAAHWSAHTASVPRGLDGRPVAARAGAIESLSRALAEPLNWARTLDVARELGATTFFELGPGDSLTRMVRERFPELPARALHEFASFDGAAKWLARASQ